MAQNNPRQRDKIRTHQSYGIKKIGRNQLVKIKKGDAVNQGVEIQCSMYD